ncbi:TrmH family RNA methyltransferase [Salinifilum aidingensis]
MTQRSSRVVSAAKLTRRAGRNKAGAFLAEGARAVREALAAHDSGEMRVRELFRTADPRHEEVAAAARALGVPVREVTDRAAEHLSETVTPQGVVAVCALPDRGVAAALAGAPTLVAVLVDIADPGNAGTVVRVADAVGADAVLFAGDCVDPYNGKAVRASTGSLFHLPIARERETAAVLAQCRQAGLRLVGADGAAEVDVDSAAEAGEWHAPTAWVLGGEAHGLPAAVSAELDAVRRVPLYGRAESLNLATATAVCLYTSARALRRG